MDTLLAELAGSFVRKCRDLSAHALAKGSARRHSLRRLHWNRRAIGISMTEVLALSGECLARTVLEHCADLNRIVALKSAESLTFKISKEHFHGTTALC